MSTTSVLLTSISLHALFFFLSFSSHSFKLEFNSDIFWCHDEKNVEKFIFGQFGFSHFVVFWLYLKKKKFKCLFLTTQKISFSFNSCFGIILCYIYIIGIEKFLILLNLLISKSQMSLYFYQYTVLQESFNIFCISTSLCLPFHFLQKGKCSLHSSHFSSKGLWTWI